LRPWPPVWVPDACPEEITTAGASRRWRGADEQCHVRRGGSRASVPRPTANVPPSRPAPRPGRADCCHRDVGVVSSRAVPTWSGRSAGRWARGGFGDHVRSAWAAHPAGPQPPQCGGSGRRHVGCTGRGV